MGLTFLNALFGAALAAVALPIVIHLLNRRRSRREKFSTLEHLAEVSRRQRRRIEVRQWLLLALRCLAVLLVVLAMMRPALRSIAGGGTGSTTAVIVLDTSFSMAAADAESSRLEAARARLDDVLALLGRGDRVQLLLPTTPPTEVFDAPIEDPGRVRGVAERLEVAYQAADHRGALARALEVVEASPNLNREIYVLSDFQARDLGDDPPFPEIPEDVRVYLVPVAERDLPNVSVAAASYVKASVSGGSAGAVRVSVANHSDGELQAYPIRVFAGDQPVGEGAIRVPVGEVATTDLVLANPSAVDGALQVRLPEDALAIDDEAWVSPDQEPSIRVLVVHGGEATTREREPYLRIALDPPGEAGERLFTVEEVPLRDLAVQTDLDHDVIILNNVERLSDGVASRLKLAHRDGAGLLFILGDRVDLRYYNTHVFDDLVPVTLRDRASVEDGGFYTLRPEVTGHPVFEGFRVTLGEELTRARFREVVRAETDGNARILARFGNLPALVEGDRVLVFTSGMDLRWGTFPTGGSFLPFVHQAVLTLATASAEARQLEAGSPILLEVPLDEVTGEVQCLGPDGTELRVTSDVQAGTVRIRTDPAPRPGLYRFLSGGEPLRNVPVHIDPAEGRLTPGDVEGVVDGLGPTSRLLAAGVSIADRVTEDRNGREIWRELLLIAFLLLMIETVVGRVRLA